MSIKTYEKEQSAIQTTVSSEYMQKRYKILLISQNSADIFLVNKLLNDLGRCKVFEAANLNAAQKIISYHTLDLIIVDDKLSSISGFEIIDRLNRSQVLREVSKVMLLSNGYNESIYLDVNYDNIDFIKKPIDKMIFKTRILSILKNKQDRFMSGSVFENMIDEKINEAKEFLKIYKSFLDIDHNLLFVYDKRSNKVVESNKYFNRFFGDSKLFNKIISNPRVLKKFVPKKSDPSYLNNHHASTWIDLVTTAVDFNFLITIKNRSKEYTFNVLINRLKLFKKDIYIVKLSNHNINIPSSKMVKLQNKKISSHLFALRQSIDKLASTKERKDIQRGIVTLLDELKISTESFIKDKYIDDNEINIYFAIAKILTDRSNLIDATINSKKITKDFKLDSEFIYARLSSDDISAVVNGILDSYHDMKNLNVDINISQFEDNLKIEIVTTNKSSDDLAYKVVNRLFKKESSKDSSEILDTTPKHVQKALKNMRAVIKTYYNGNQNVFLITIPL